MAKSTNIGHLKDNLSRVLREVSRGATVDVQNRNVTIARLVPASPRISRTKLGFDPRVKLLAPIDEPLLTPVEWGSLWPGAAA